MAPASCETPRPSSKQPVSRILSGLAPWTAIPLGDASLRRSSNLPESFRRRGFCALPGSTLARRAGTHSSFSGPRCCSLPIWSCSVWGLPCHLRYRRRGALLPHLFTLTCAYAPAVSSLWHWPSPGLDARVPDVIRHTALWSSDFPPPANAGGGRPAARLSMVTRIVC